MKNLYDEPSADLAANQTRRMIREWGEVPPEENAAVLECQNCRQICTRTTWIPEYEIEMCNTCRDEAMALRESIESPCPTRLELANNCSSVSEFSGALRAHLSACVSCNPCLKTVQGDRLPLNPPPACYDGKVA